MLEAFPELAQYIPTKDSVEGEHNGNGAGEARMDES